MSENYKKAHAALDSHLDAYQSTDVAWENADYKPIVGTPYLKPRFLPAEPEQAALGSTGSNRLGGIYQVSVIHPIGGGSAAAKAQADAIVSQFKRGTQLTRDDLTIRVDRAWQGPAMDSEAWYTIPVSIRWFVYAPNT